MSIDRVARLIRNFIRNKSYLWFGQWMCQGKLGNQFEQHFIGSDKSDTSIVDVQMVMRTGLMIINCKLW